MKPATNSQKGTGIIHPLPFHAVVLQLDYGLVCHSFELLILIQN
jgi:hypothetical protein